jgi:hypothetical protein
MTIAELIKQLEKYPRDTIVLAHDPDTHLEQPITGMVHDPIENSVYLYTEDDSPPSSKPAQKRR